MPFALRECLIRIATSEANLAVGYLLYSWHLPEPTTPFYNDHSVKIATADGGQSLRGYRIVRILWNRLSAEQTQILNGLVREVKGNGGLLYMTVDKGWSNIARINNWIDISGRPSIIDTGPAQGTSGTMRDNVELTLNNVSVINDPANF